MKLISKIIYVLLFFFCNPIFIVLIVSYLNTADGRIWHVKSAGTGTTAEGTTWANAMNCDSMIHVLENDVSAGDMFFVKDSGTLTLTESIDASARDGSATSPITIIGVKSGTTNDSEAVVYSDWSVDSSDRPFFDCVTYQFKVGDYYTIRNIYAQGSISNTVYTGTYCQIENCKFDNDNGSSAARYSLNAAGNVAYCEFLSANCGGLSLGGDGSIMFSTFHNISDATNGVAINITGRGAAVCSNILNDCHIAIAGAANYGIKGVNNTIYNCDVGVSLSTAYSSIFINNILDSCKVDGFIATTQTNNNLYWNNHGDNTRNVDMWDGIDTTSIFKDHVVSTGDPLFTNPASGDFSLQAESPCLNTGTDSPK